MSTEFEELSAVDFLLFMDNVDSFDLIRLEYYTIEQNRKICEVFDDEPDNKGCRQLLHRFLCCMKRYPRADFINVYDAYDGQQKYICTSDPKAENYDKFWELAWCREVNTIVKISQSREEGSCQYWSSREESEIECGSFRIKTLIVIKRPRFIATLLLLSDQKNCEREIWHYHYTASPTDNNPDDPFIFLSFVCSLNDTYTISKKKQSAERKPEAVLVHCTDSSSFSAIYCILDICVTEFKYTGALSVANASRKIRQREHNCLNYNADDYSFCYQAIHMYVLGEMGLSQKYLDERGLN
ncbi:GSCOCT00013209001.2-RA-CDS [Cotesia congregata]|uniref:Cc_ptp.alpha_17.4 n=2 Tax=root TaxID=1 RepID=S6CVT3_COTCN|nr:protein-tyrosine phosphatase [Bracoviriform congregatae]CAD6244011.1 GSCOCT00013209001.2-RA-CDS [Cotesia congregata]CAG17458.1 protein-tyrosine phosphatase [Bracoviriform congregatae]CAG26746.1 protein tyrosine phosphatase [Bracoviriform congregatae]CAG5075841.1 cc_ptp.alpha_17.4 [Cotesia congregata]CCQ71291.1 protein tyrosine phosphatase PTPalpha [Cotesia congregata bracovirus] [Cotesia congregata]